MFFFDIILAMFLQLALVVGEEAALAVLTFGGLAIAIGSWWIVNRFVDSLVDSGSDGVSLNRSPRTRFNGMPDSELAEHLGKNPKDAVALREQIRRNRATANPAELAAQIESFLAMGPKLPTEDLAMLHHQLADLYCGPLGQRLRATQILAAFADANPDSRESQFMRDRIKQIGTMEVQ